VIEVTYEQNTGGDCQHDYSIRLSLPVKSMGAVHGWTPYRECSRCGQRTPETAEDSQPDPSGNDPSHVLPSGSQSHPGGTGAPGMAPIPGTGNTVVLDSDDDPYEYAVVVPGMYADGNEPVVAIGISKAGGGTLGESYSGTWAYAITCDGQTVISGADMGSGTPHTHPYMARIVADYFYAAGESLYLRAGDSEHAGEYDEAQTAFLVSEYERLGSFAEGGE
jgi:hypothetical protein